MKVRISDSCTRGVSPPSCGDLTCGAFAVEKRLCTRGCAAHAPSPSRCANLNFYPFVPKHGTWTEGGQRLVAHETLRTQRPMSAAASRSLRLQGLAEASGVPREAGAHELCIDVCSTARMRKAGTGEKRTEQGIRGVGTWVVISSGMGFADFFR